MAGRGPLHAVAVAREIGIRTVIIPRAGVFSAFGMLFSDLRYDFVRTWFRRLEEASFEEIEQFIALRLGGRGQRRDQRTLPGRARQKTTVERAADMRYVGQEHPVTVDFGRVCSPSADRDGIKRYFDDALDALRHLRPERTGRDREPAHHGGRHDGETAAAKAMRAGKRARRRQPPASAVFAASGVLLHARPTRARASRG